MSESLVCVFLIDSRMVFAGVFAAFQHQRDKRQKLRIGVTGIMDMGRRLFHNMSVKEQGLEGRKGEGATYPISSEKQACQAVCTSSEETRRTTNKPLVHDSNLQ